MTRATTAGVGLDVGLGVATRQDTPGGNGRSADEELVDESTSGLLSVVSRDDDLEDS